MSSSQRIGRFHGVFAFPHHLESAESHGLCHSSKSRKLLFSLWPRHWHFPEGNENIGQFWPIILSHILSNSTFVCHTGNKSLPVVAIVSRAPIRPMKCQQKHRVQTSSAQIVWKYRLNAMAKCGARKNEFKKKEWQLRFDLFYRILPEDLASHPVCSFAFI